MLKKNCVLVKGIADFGSSKKDDRELDDKRKVMQEFYVPLKANEQYVKFCFITGITKFSQLKMAQSYDPCPQYALRGNL